MLPNPAMVSGVTDASVPPVIITSASPSCTRRNAFPMACALDEHAETVA